MPRIAIAGESLFYSTSAEGKQSPPALLLHGAGGTHLTWPPELRRLPGTRAYAIDLPGHGRSGGRGRDTIAAYAETAAAFLQALGYDKAIIIGHSMGGAIALTLALDWNCASGLVLIATGARLRVAPAILETARDNPRAAIDLLTRLVWSPGADPALVAHGRQTLLSTAGALWGDFLACDRFDMRARLSEIRVPTLVIVGSADQMTPVQHAHFLASHIAGARLQVIAGAGHMVILEKPAEVARLICSHFGLTSY